MVALETARLRAILELRFTAGRRSLALSVESLATCKAGETNAESPASGGLAVGLESSNIELQ